MVILCILAVLCVIGVTLFIVKQETPEQKEHDEKYTKKEYKLRDALKEIRQAVKSNNKEKKND